MGIPRTAFRTAVRLLPIAWAVARRYWPEIKHFMEQNPHVVLGVRNQMEEIARSRLAPLSPGTLLHRVNALRRQIDQIHPPEGAYLSPYDGTTVSTTHEIPQSPRFLPGPGPSVTSARKPMPGRAPERAAPVDASPTTPPDRSTAAPPGPSNTALDAELSPAVGTIGSEAGDEAILRSAGGETAPPRTSPQQRAEEFRSQLSAIEASIHAARSASAKARKREMKRICAELDILTQEMVTTFLGRQLGP